MAAVQFCPSSPSTPSHCSLLGPSKELLVPAPCLCTGPAGSSSCLPAAVKRHPPRQQQECSSTRGKQSPGETHLLHPQRYRHLKRRGAEAGGLSRELTSTATEGQRAGAAEPGAFPLHGNLHWLNPPAAGLHPCPPTSCDSGEVQEQGSCVQSHSTASCNSEPRLSLKRIKSKFQAPLLQQALTGQIK